MWFYSYSSHQCWKVVTGQACYFFVCLAIFPFMNHPSPTSVILHVLSLAPTPHTRVWIQWLSRSGQVTPEVPVRSLFWVWCNRCWERVLFIFWNMSYKNHASLEHLVAILLPHGERLSENKTKQRSSDFQSYHLLLGFHQSWRDSKYLDFPIKQVNRIPQIFVCLLIFYCNWADFFILSTK